MPGVTIGSTTFTNVLNLFAPSTHAASSISNGTVWKKPINSHTAYGTENERYTIIRPSCVLVNPAFAIIIEYGTANKIGGNIYVVISTRVIALPKRGKKRTMPYAASADIAIASNVVTNDTNKLLAIFPLNLSWSSTIL